MKRSLSDFIRALVFTGYGLNSEYELAACFERAGCTTVDVRHVNHLIQRPALMETYDILAFPGGFSYGDHLGSGRLFAAKIKQHLLTELHAFIERGKPVIGICNGFQTLACLGILPFAHMPHQASQPNTATMALSHNQQGRFEDRWIRLLPNRKNRSFWLRDLPSTFFLPVRHGEGRCVFRSRNVLDTVLKEMSHYIAFQYASYLARPTMRYPDNPNGSPHGIAGLTNKEGNVLGLMPHPEVFMIREQYPLWKAHAFIPPKHKKWSPKDGMGMLLFYNAVGTVKMLKQRGAL